MNITAYQVLAPLASILAILYAWSLVFRNKKTVWESSIWTIFWCAISAIAIFPDLLEYLTQITGIQKRENAVFISSIGIIFFAIFYIVMRLEAMEQRQTRIARKMALKDIDDKE